MQKMPVANFHGLTSPKKQVFNWTTLILLWESFNYWEFWWMRSIWNKKRLGKLFTILFHTLIILFFLRLWRNGVSNSWEDCYLVIWSWFISSISSGSTKSAKNTLTNGKNWILCHWWRSQNPKKSEWLTFASLDLTKLMELLKFILSYWKRPFSKSFMSFSPQNSSTWPTEWLLVVGFSVPTLC